MGFKKFLESYYGQDTPEDIVAKILKDCKPFLSQKQATYRGMGRDENYGDATVRKDRKPLNTPEPLHDLLNLIHKQHNLPSRAESMFVTKNPWTSNSYGRNMVVFPVGKFRTMFYKDGHDITWNVGNAAKALGERVSAIDEKRTGQRPKWAAVYHFWNRVADYYKKHKSLKKTFTQFKKDYEKDFLTYLPNWKREQGKEPDVKFNKSLWDSCWKDIEGNLGKVENFVANSFKGWKEEEMVIECDEYYFIEVGEYTKDVYAPLHKFIKPDGATQFQKEKADLEDKKAKEREEKEEAQKKEKEEAKKMERQYLKDWDDLSDEGKEWYKKEFFGMGKGTINIYRREALVDAGFLKPLK